MDAILSDLSREDAVAADMKLVSLSGDTTDEATHKVLQGVRQFLHAGMYIEAERLVQKINHAPPANEVVLGGPEKFKRPIAKGGV